MVMGAERCMRAIMHVLSRSSSMYWLYFGICASRIWWDNYVLGSQLLPLLFQEDQTGAFSNPSSPH